MKYQQYTFTSSVYTGEVILALISNLPFDSFEDNETTCKAYIPISKADEQFVSAVRSLSEKFDLKYIAEDIPYVNWNKEWEANFSPVIVEDICAIRASFHEEKLLPETKYTINISPKMAFGTGHHATTYLMIQTMYQLDFSDVSVFDYGCGTGILSVFAEQLGAQSVFGIDIESPAIENSEEHAELNNCTKCTFKEGTIDLLATSEKPYKVILANINRKVILESLSRLYDLLEKEGDLLLSGVLKKDWETLSSSLDFQKFSFKAKFEKDNWLCVHLSK